jgi:phosphohistidine swiveling domain-containing protein
MKVVKNDQIIEKFNLTEWHHWLNRPYSPFWATFGWLGISKKYFKKVGFDYFATDELLYQYPDMYYSEEFYRRSIIWARQFFEKNKVSDLTMMLEKVHKKNMRELAGLLVPSDPIEFRLKKYFELIHLYTPFLWLVLPLETHFNERIEKKFKRYFPENYMTVAADASLPRKKTAYEIMVAELIAGNPLEEVQKKYGWIRSRDGFSPFYSIKDLREIRKNHKHEVRSNKNQKHVLPKSLNLFIEELKELTFFRTDRTDKMYEYFNGGRPLFKDLAKKMGIRYGQLKYYDVISLLEGRKEKYPKHFSYALLDGQYAIRSGKIFPEIVKHDSDEIKGQVAFRGKVKGKIKIVLHPNDIGKVRKGDILVTQMTFPSFIAAMQKAAAFVTDEGGITCHAAIISREMKKPCIIGTKIATQVLHDGNLVEVDADKGIINILKNGEE